MTTSFNRCFLLIGSFVLRDMRLNWLRTVLTIFGIALGVAVMLAINLANGTTLSRFEDSINLVAGKANLELRSTSTADLDENILSDLNSLWDEGVLLTPVIDEMAVVPGEKPDVVEVLGVDMFADPAFRPFSYNNGADAKSTDDNAIFSKGSVFVGEKFAGRHGLQIGSKFKVLVNDRAKEFSVGGIIAKSGPGGIFGGNLLLMDIGPAQEALDMQGRISRVDMIVPPNNLSDLQTKLNATMPRGIIDERPSRRGQQVEKMLSAFQYNLAALSLIALLVGMFVIYNTMSITVVRKRSEIGVLRAIGASKQRIFLVFLVQALLLGSLGSLAGLGLGSFFAGAAVKAVARTVQALYVDQPPADITIQWPALAIAFAFGLLMTIVASLAPIIEAMSVPPAEATRRASGERRIATGSRHLAVIGCLFLGFAAYGSVLPAINGFPLFGYISAALTIFGVSLCMPLLLSKLSKSLQSFMSAVMGTEGKLAILTLNGALGRTSVTVASLMLGIAMMASLAIMIGSFRETVIVWVNQSLKADLYVAPLSRAVSKRSGRLPNETVERIRKMPGVAEADAFVDIPIEYEGDPTDLGAADLDVLARHGGLMFVGGRDSHTVLSQLEHDSACLITESFALHHGVHDGDILTLQSPHGTFQAKVAGTYYDYASERGYIVIPRWLYREQFPDLYASTVGVYLNPGADTETVRAELAQMLGVDTGLSVRTNSDLRREVLRVFDNTFAITYALHAVSIIVAILGVLNAMLSTTFEMRRDFAVLRSLGASVKQIQKIILVQAGTLGLLGNVFGIGVGLLLSLLLIHVINKQSFGWTVQLNIPVWFLVQSFVLILIASIASGWLPARSAGRDVCAEAVRVE